MSFATVAAVVSIGSGIFKAVQGNKQAKLARKEAAEAKEELEKGKKMFANLDTSNPYLNMENTMEDLTVNQQQAEFTKQQQMQNQANVMQQMRGAAGGSGIAALAQSLVQQGSADAQKASASIGAQEAANQKAERAMAGDIQAKEREGEMLSRNQQFGKISSMMGMSAGEMVGAQQRQQAGQEAVYGGITDAATGMVDYGVNEGLINPAAWGTGVNSGTASDRKLKKDIKQISRSPSGLNIYSFKYIDKSFGEGVWQGVMSDEIPQHAVIKHEDGYDRVDYSRLDVEFKQI